MPKIIALFISILLLSQVTAQAATFYVDPVDSKITFTVKYLAGQTVGKFTKFGGSIELNASNSALVGLNGVLDIRSITTNNKDREEDLLSEKFFYAEKFPQGTFKLTKVKNEKVTADVTLRGVTKSVTFDYSFLGTARDEKGRYKTALVLKGKINRKDFGISHNMKTDSGQWMISDEVGLTIELQGLVQK